MCCAVRTGSEELIFPPVKPGTADTTQDNRHTLISRIERERGGGGGGGGGGKRERETDPWGS